MKPATVVLLAALLPWPGQAQTVYRCGQAYQNEPCDQGRAVDVADPRTPAQRREAEQVARDEARRGRTMERERLAGAKPTLATVKPAKSAKKPDKAAPPAGKPARKDRDAAGKDFVAVVPGGKKARRD